MTSAAAAVVNVIINGGGLVGALAAMYMRRRGYRVTVVEKRSDIRRATAESGRSINLILTSRGLYALRQIGLEAAAIALSVPVKGRMMHAATSALTFQPYGISAAEVNYSISRTKLNALLLDHAERSGAVLHFEYDLQGIDLATNVATYRTKTGAITSLQADFIVGTDGAGSGTRRALIDGLRQHGVPAYDCIDRLGISYRELTFGTSSAGQYSMSSESLHIWPRGTHFLMALADKTPTFTGTLYLPDGSAELRIPSGSDPVPTFAELEKDRPRLEAFIRKVYPDVPALVPDFADQLTDPKRPAGFLASLRTTHWHLGGKLVLMGDAAHAITPFFGQGMNLGFESVVILDQLLTHFNGDATKAFAAFQTVHQPSATSIANMAIENFGEMSYKVGLPQFVQRKAVENQLEQRLPQVFRSRYYLATKTLVPYAVVYATGALADRCVDDVLATLAKKGGPAAGSNDVSSLSDDELKAIVAARFTPFAVQHGIDHALRDCSYAGFYNAAAMLRRPPFPVTAGQAKL